MSKIHISFVVFGFLLAKECLGMTSIFSTITKSFHPLPFILTRGEYHFPEKFYPTTIERKTNNNGEKLVLFCPAKMNQIKNFDEYCMVPLENTASSCKQQVKPVLVKSKELEIRCGINGESVYYDFVFRDETLSVKAVDHLMYRICYNVEKNEAIFTYHRIVSPNLLKEEFLQNERRTTHDLSIEEYKLPKNTFKRMKTTFSNLNGFNKRFKKDQAKFNKIKELLLVSPDHMAHSSWKIPVYHFINVKPAWDFTIEAWDKINSFFEDTIQDTEFIQISGTKDVWILHGETVYLDHFETITIPKYFWKLVYIPAKKALLLVILHNIPDPESKLEKLCEDNSNRNIHQSTSTTPDYVYYCDPKIITDLYNLPSELDTLQRTEYFSPLVMSNFNGVYDFPKEFHGFRSSSETNNQVLFCPPIMNENEIYEESCLIPNEHENPYCLKSVEPTYMQKSLKHNCGMSLERSTQFSSTGFQLCFKNRNTESTDNENPSIEKYEVVILDICEAFGETLTMHKFVSPQLLFNKYLSKEKSINYLKEDSFTKTNIDEYKIVKNNNGLKNKYASFEGETLTMYPLVSPNDMPFLAWRKSVSAPLSFEFAWNKMATFRNIIDRQIQIQAADENQEFTEINGTWEHTFVKNQEPQFSYVLSKKWWKVVYTPDMKKNIAIIVHNETDNNKIGEKLCEESTCNMSQWNFGSLSDLEDFAYCCDAEVITKKFDLPQAPRKLEIKDYHLPLVIKQDEDEEFYLADTYNGLDNLEENQILFCPAELDKQGYDEYYLFPNEKKIPYCKYPLKPFLISNKPYKGCGGDKHAQEFSFSYKIDIKHGNSAKTTFKFFDIYTVCFNSDKQETLFTFHYVKSTALLSNPKLEEERQMIFKLSTTSGRSTFIFTKLEENLYKTAYKFPDSEFIHYLVPLFLISPDDMAFAVWKKPTYHYINVKPSFEKVVELWNSINTHIRNLAMNETFAFAQMNGFMDYLEINGEMMTLNDHKTGIPNAFWKIVHSMDQLGFKDIAIIVHNVPDGKYISRKYCQENVCKNRPELGFLVSDNDVVYCCDAADVENRFHF